MAKIFKDGQGKNIINKIGKTLGGVVLVTAMATAGTMMAQKYMNTYDVDIHENIYGTMSLLKKEINDDKFKKINHENLKEMSKEPNMQDEVKRFVFEDYRNIQENIDFYADSEDRELAKEKFSENIIKLKAKNSKYLENDIGDRNLNGLINQFINLALMPEYNQTKFITTLNVALDGMLDITASKALCVKNITKDGQVKELKTEMTDLEIKMGMIGLSNQMLDMYNYNIENIERSTFDIENILDENFENNIEKIELNAKNAHLLSNEDEIKRSSQSFNDLIRMQIDMTIESISDNNEQEKIKALDKLDKISKRINETDKAVDSNNVVLNLTNNIMDLKEKISSQDFENHEELMLSLNENSIKLKNKSESLETIYNKSEYMDMEKEKEKKELKKRIRNTSRTR